MDDLPLHQTPEPLAHVATGDRNAYDRYFFNGYTADGSVFFAAALGVYPNRDVVDAAFSVVRDGVQTSVHASGRLVPDRRTTVGPIEVRVLSPMRRLQVVVGPNDASSARGRGASPSAPTSSSSTGSTSSGAGTARGASARSASGRSGRPGEHPSSSGCGHR
jgi:hypothetical protein